jgi:hypothetical protein
MLRIKNKLLVLAGSKAGSKNLKQQKHSPLFVTAFLVLNGVPTKAKKALICRF